MTDIDGAKAEIREALARLVQAAERLGRAHWTLEALDAERTSVASRARHGMALPTVRGVVTKARETV